jgi:activator of HSP90 ATPase
VTPNNVSPASTSITPSRYDRDKAINSGYRTNSQTSNNNQGNIAKESKSTDINFNLNFNVNPKDYKNSFMDILNQSDFGKHVAKHITNNFKENSALRGYTPSTKINVTV